MDSEKQKLIIEYLISDSDTFALCQGVVKPEYFNPEYRNAIKFIQTYFNTYNAIPSVEQVYAESKQQFIQYQVTQDQIQYCAKQIEQYCRRKAMENAVIEGAKLINEGKYGSIETIIRDAMMVSLNQNLGTRYFHDPVKRLNEMMQNDPTESTGWTTVDELLYGGITRGELLLFSANSGGGKSITLANLALNFVKRNRNVLYITLELSEKIVSQRFDTMISGYNRKEWKGHVSEIVSDIEVASKKSGELDIKFMPSGTSPNALRAYLKEYHLHYKHMPDLLIIDYLDNMSPNEYVSADNVWVKDKYISEQLRQIGADYNMFVATASQLNRDAVKAAQHDHSHIAGGISKINVSDVYISIKMTETMKAQGQMLFSFQKTRNSDGVGKNLFMKWDNKRLLISDATKLFSGKEQAKSGLVETHKGKDLLGLFDN